MPWISVCNALDLCVTPWISMPSDTEGAAHPAYGGARRRQAYMCLKAAQQGAESLAK